MIIFRLGVKNRIYNFGFLNYFNCLYMYFFKNYKQSLSYYIKSYFNSDWNEIFIDSIYKDYYFN